MGSSIQSMGSEHFGGLLGTESAGERELRNFSTARFNDPDIQGFLPNALRRQFTDPILQAGIQGIGDLIRDPGGLNPNIASAIRPQLAMTSERISQNFRGIGQQQAGTFARTNAPVSIRTALESALNVEQSRSQRGARREALTQSEQLRRSDLSQTFDLLNSIFQFTQGGRGVGVQGLGQAAQSSVQRQAANQAFQASLIQSFADMMGGMGGGAAG